MLNKLSLRILFVSIAILGIAGLASAAPMNWEGTATVKLGDFAEARPTGGGVATLNALTSNTPAHLDSLRLVPSRGGLTANFTKFVTDPDSVGNSIASVQFVGIEAQTGTFAPISGAAGSATVTPKFNGFLPLAGIVRLCLINTTCDTSASLILTTHTAGSSTIGIGIGGLLTINILGGAARISVQANPWQIKTATIYDQITTPINGLQTTVTRKYNGWAHGPGSATTTTAQIGGVVQLISASQVRTNLPQGSSVKVASAQTLLIRFVPEPGMLLMIGSGIAGLVLIGRKRMRK